MERRRSSRICPENTLQKATSTIKTRRQSVAPTAVTPNEEKITYKKKLNYDEICEDLEHLEDEIEISQSEENTGKNENNLSNSDLIMDDDSISVKIKLRRLSDKINYKVIEYKIGMIEKRNTRSSLNYKINKSQRLSTRRSCTTAVKSYNEDKLMENQEKMCQNNSRKRSIQRTSSKSNKVELDTSISEYDDEVDENGMNNANINLSPKKLRTVSTPKNSPIKPNLGTPKSSIRPSKVSMNTPIKGMKNLRMSESTPSKQQKHSLELKSYPQSLKNKQTKGKSRTNNKKPKKSSTYDEDYVFEENMSEDYQSDSCDEEIESEDEEDSSGDTNSSTIYSPTKRSKQGRTTSNKKSRNFAKTPSKSIKSLSKISMETPTKQLSRLSLHASLTPSMHHRSANIIKPSTPLQEARLKLHVSVLPKSLPCREEQFNDIYSFLHARLSDGSGGCIYISGVPGTGKTATVNEVIRCLKKSMNSGKLTKFEFIDINGMKLSEPRQAYVQIWKQLTGTCTTWEEAQKLLHERFTKSKSKQGMTLLLVDELDLLCTKRQDVVYNLLDWPSKTNAKLVVVTIANTMDLPERILMGKVTSRLGLTRLTFPPYNYKQLEEIVISRMRGHNAFSGETVQLVARKVAAVSGDARRALDICRRATEVAEINGREIVSMIDVKQALEEMIASPKIQAIKHCSDFEKYFLQSVCAEVTRTGVEEVVFKNVYFQLESLCSLNGEKTPNLSEALSMCARLGSWRLLLCDHSRADIHQRLLLNVSTDDVHFAIQNN